MGRSRSFDAVMAVILLWGALCALGPLYLVIVTASHSADELVHYRLPLTPGGELAANLMAAWTQAQLGRKLLNSLIVCMIVTAIKLTLATVTAFAFVYFRTRLRTIGFAVILLTLMLPLETRIAPTYGVAADILSPLRALARLAGIAVNMHWTILDTYLGLSLPVAATATGTFLFRQFFRTIPVALVDAARADGAGPLRFFVDIVLPLSRGNLFAFGIVTFIATWNEYLWPLLVTTTPDMQTAMLAIRSLVPDPENPVPAWNVTLAGVLAVAILPVAVTALFQRQFIKGLTGTHDET